MFRHLSLVLALGVILILCSPLVSFAQMYNQPQTSPSSPQTSAPPPPTYSPPQRLSSESPRDGGGWYLMIKPGAYFPTGKVKDSGFDTGFTGELTMGTYYTRNLALEAGVGYLQTEASATGVDFHEEDKIWVIPVTVTFKGVLPLRGLELNAGGGGGVYFANINAEGSGPAGSFSNDGSRTAVGGHAVAGMNVNFSRKAFLGIEGKYIFTNTVDLLGTRVNLNGFMLTGILGFRF